jgi:hypothetical protein
LSNNKSLEVNVAISQKKLSGMIFHKKNDRKQNERKSWELTVCAMVSTGKNLDFLKIYFANRILPNHAKSWKWVMFKTLLCQTTWFQMNVWYTIWKYTQSGIIWAQKNSKSKIHILPIYGQTDSKLAIVVTYAQGSDLAVIFGDLSQRSQSEKLSEIKPPLDTASIAQWSQTVSIWIKDSRHLFKISKFYQN